MSTKQQSWSISRSQLKVAQLALSTIDKWNGEATEYETWKESILHAAYQYNLEAFFKRELKLPIIHSKSPAQRPAPAMPTPSPPTNSHSAPNTATTAAMRNIFSGEEDNEQEAVSYTHLTLPTKRIV